MILRAISTFNWRGRLYEIGESIEVPDDKIASRLIAEKLATLPEKPAETPDPIEAAAPQSKPVTETTPDARDIASTPAPKQKTDSKKKSRRK